MQNPCIQTHIHKYCSAPIQFNFFTNQRSGNEGRWWGNISERKELAFTNTTRNQLIFKSENIHSFCHTLYSILWNNYCRVELSSVLSIAMMWCGATTQTTKSCGNYAQIRISANWILLFSSFRFSKQYYWKSYWSFHIFFVKIFEILLMSDGSFRLFSNCVFFLQKWIKRKQNHSR